MNGEDAKKRGHTYFQWIFVLSANTTTLIFGMENGWISPFTSLLRSTSSPTGYPLTDIQISWVVSILSLIAMFAVSLLSYTADRYGRKVAVIIMAVFQLISWIIRLSYTSLPLLIIARATAGLSAGGVFTIIPMYSKEICQNDLTGIFGTFPMLMYTIGIFLMYLMGAYLDYATVAVILIILSILAMLAVIVAPETPPVLVKQGKIDKATETIALLRGLDKNDVLVKELVDIMIEEEKHFKSLNIFTFLNILQNKSWRRGLILITVLFTFYEMNGGFVILTFATTMLASTGMDYVISPQIQSLCFPIVMIAASVGLASCIERFGRKPLLFYAFAITALAMLSMAVIIVVQSQYGNVPTWMPVVVLIVTVALCTGGVSPLIFIVLTELFNFQIRARMMGVVVTYSWLVTVVSQSSYMAMASALGEFAPFVVYGIINLLGAFYVIIFLVETRSKTENEIYENIKKQSNFIYCCK